MSKYAMRLVDSSIIESTFSVEEKEFDEFEDDGIQLRDLEQYLDKLPPKEVDLIEMYYGRKKKQKEIADFFNVSQGAISHRLSRARKRLQFLRDMPKIEDHYLRTRLQGTFEKLEADILFHMVKTTCQSKTAILINEKHNLSGKDRMTQVKVRHKFVRCLDVLEKKAALDQTLFSVYKLVSYIRDNPYMLHEVPLPHFDRGANVTYLEEC